MASIFKRIIDREIPAHIVAETPEYLAFLDISPLKKGHTLVIPKQEVDYIFDLDEVTYTGLMRFAKQVAGALKSAIPCNRIGVAVVGLEVPHAHVHLVPLEEINDLNFGNPRVNMEADELKAVAQSIRSEFEQ